MAEQLELFADKKTELDALWEAQAKSKLSYDTMRKRLFAEISDLKNQIIELRASNDKIAAAISKNVEFLAS